MGEGVGCCIYVFLSVLRIRSIFFRIRIRFLKYGSGSGWPKKDRIRILLRYVYIYIYICIYICIYSCLILIICFNTNYNVATHHTYIYNFTAIWVGGPIKWSNRPSSVCTITSTLEMLHSYGVQRTKSRDLDLSSWRAASKDFRLELKSQNNSNSKHICW